MMSAQTENIQLGRRKRDTSVEFTPEKKLKVKSVFSDPYHEIEIVGVFSHPDLEILELHPEIIRHPHNACRESVGTLKGMVGERVGPGSMKRMLEKVGKRGCFHLNAVFRDTIEGALFGRGRRVRQLLAELYPDITYAQIYKVALTFRPELMNSCNAYNGEGELVEQILHSPMPEGMDFDTIRELEEFYEEFRLSQQTERAAMGKF